MIRINSPIIISLLPSNQCGLHWMIELSVIVATGNVSVDTIFYVHVFHVYSNDVHFTGIDWRKNGRKNNCDKHSTHTDDSNWTYCVFIWTMWFIADDFLRLINVCFLCLSTFHMHAVTVNTNALAASGQSDSQTTRQTTLNVCEIHFHVVLWEQWPHFRRMPFPRRHQVSEWIKKTGKMDTLKLFKSMFIHYRLTYKTKWFQFMHDFFYFVCVFVPKMTKQCSMGFTLCGFRWWFIHIYYAKSYHVRFNFCLFFELEYLSYLFKSDTTSIAIKRLRIIIIINYPNCVNRIFNII